jgi:hypothetical protein
MSDTHLNGSEIAIIGLAGRFSGAKILINFGKISKMVLIQFIFLPMKN